MGGVALLAVKPTVATRLHHSSSMMKSSGDGFGLVVVVVSAEFELVRMVLHFS